MTTYQIRMVIIAINTEIKQLVEYGGYREQSERILALRDAQKELQKQVVAV